MNEVLFQNTFKYINNNSSQDKHLYNQIPYAIHNAIHKGRCQECPRCQSKNYVKNGTFNRVQRYICKECKKSFCIHTNTPWYYSKKPFFEWIRYYNNMFYTSSTLREIAEERNIALGTAFKWRHKILNFIKRKEGKNTLSQSVGIASIKMGKNNPISEESSSIIFDYKIIHFAMDKRKNILVFSEKVHKYMKAHEVSKSPVNIDRKSNIFIWNRYYKPKNISDDFKITIGIDNEYADRVQNHVFTFKSWKSKFKGIGYRYFNNYGYWSFVKSLGRSSNIFDYLSSLI